MKNKIKKVKCPHCSKRFKWLHVCRLEDSGRNKDFGITRAYAIKNEK